jgi:hypothetical protein
VVGITDGKKPFGRSRGRRDPKGTDYEGDFVGAFIPVFPFEVIDYFY